jgi:hypothetical protein
MMSNKIKNDKPTKSLFKTSIDIVLVIIVSVIVALSFSILSIYNEFVRQNDLVLFTIFEILVFASIMMYKRYKKN